MGWSRLMKKATHPQDAVSRPMLLTNLPVDILGCIVELFQDDFSTLRTLSLVCGLLRPLAHRHLFYQLGIGGDFRFTTSPAVASSRCLQFKDFLISSPSLLSHVRDLRVYASFHAQDDWVMKNMEVLTDILNHFSEAHLEKFYIHSYPGTVSWKQLSKPFRDAMLNIFSKIQAIDMLGFRDFPIDIFTCCTNLRVLNVDEMNFADTVATSPNINSLDFKPAIRSLKLFGKLPGIIEILTLSGTLDLSQLETLDVGMWAKVLDIDPLLHSDQIRELHLRWFTIGSTNIDFGLHQQNDLSQLDQLTVIRLNTCWMGGVQASEIHWIANTLDSIHGHRLTSVELTLFVYFEPQGGEFEALHVLSASLARLSKHLRVLKKISLSIWLIRYTEDLPAVEEGIRKQVHSDWERNDELFLLKVVRAPGSGGRPQRRCKLYSNHVCLLILASRICVSFFREGPTGPRWLSSG
ncbi:hypothetical protein BDN72DRAFT_127602 [Pluteus cervinus]|uniref:Uncharacterized protein n=1 Tax=Pluteus cervinus TaxID=181527 RepID=A0ACD3AMS2_9AGAR|nr:hypothetical protein BDN72DRAFT_127602 [Pluteus cervinus]